MTSNTGLLTNSCGVWPKKWPKLVFFKNNKLHLSVVYNTSNIYVYWLHRQPQSAFIPLIGWVSIQLHAEAELLTSVGTVPDMKPKGSRLILSFQ